jgi:hypothetical protein
MTSSHLEQQFADLWLNLYPDIDLHSEYRFSPPRRYRWDFCHLESKIAIEIQGGVWMGKSGHSGGTGLVQDYEKLCLAAAKGWRVFLLADSMITDEYLGSIATAICCGVQQPLLSPELPNNSILGNSLTAKELRQQRGYIGHIRPKTIKGHKYYYWIYYDRGKRVEKYMGTDLKGSIEKVRSIGDPLSDKAV